VIRQGISSSRTLKTNIASISYHFGGKEGLRTACAAHVVATIRQVAGFGDGPQIPVDLPADAARLLLLQFVDRMVRFLLNAPEAGLIAGFIVREMAHPSRALDIIYEGLIDAAHRRICALWSAATGRPAESVEVRLAVFAAIGQVIYFHLGRPIVQRRMGWRGYGPAETDAIAATIAANLTARLDADRTVRT